jgi:hypothetical protein
MIVTRHGLDWLLNLLNAYYVWTTNSYSTFNVQHTLQVTAAHTKASQPSYFLTVISNCWLLTSNELQTHFFSVSGNLLLAFASTVVLDSGPHRTHDHILLSHDSDWVVRRTYSDWPGQLDKLMLALTSTVLSVSWVGRLLLLFTSTVIFGSGSCGTHDCIFLSHDSDLYSPGWLGKILLALAA